MKQLKLTPEQAEKVAAKKARHRKATIDPEWYFVAEFGSYFGWQGVMAILKDEIDIDAANLLLLGARKVRYNHLIDDALSTQVAVSSANSGKGATKVFNKGMASFMKEAKI